MPDNGTDSVNVFLTKSFWAPLSMMIATDVALAAQPWVEIGPDVQKIIGVLVTALIIALVRRVTNRPAHFVKPKETSQ